MDARRIAAELEGSEKRRGPSERGVWRVLAEMVDLGREREGVGEEAERQR